MIYGELDRDLSISAKLLFVLFYMYRDVRPYSLVIEYESVNCLLVLRQKKGLIDVAFITS